MFNNDTEANGLMKNISDRLLSGGYALMTFSDAATIVKKIRERGTENSKGEYVFSNSFFSMRLNKAELEKQ